MACWVLYEEVVEGGEPTGSRLEERAAGGLGFSNAKIRERVRALGAAAIVARRSMPR